MAVKPDAVVIDACRTPIGRAFKGAFAKTRSDDLGAWCIEGLMRRTKLDPNTVEDVLVGCAMTEGPQGYNVARQVALLGGLPDTAGAATINRFCSSSAYAMAVAHSTIESGWNDCIVAGGVETMSLIPMVGMTPELYLNPRMVEVRKSYYNAMGITAEEVASRYKVSREDMDRWGVRSHTRAEAAQKAGRFDGEIVPVTVNGTVVSKDEGIRYGSTYEATAALKPAFRPDGVVTAGNASQMSDGAAMSLITSSKFAEQHSLEPKGRILGAAVAGVAPEVMGIGPVPAVRKLLAQTNTKVSDLDHFEINEAFASQVLACIRELQVPEEIVNPDGGAIALGHPLGASGARIAAHIFDALGKKGGGLAVETMCVGGGQGFAILFEVY
ncbi:MAG: acetyl-CoA acyltransferase [Thermoplasmata archaeon]|jgi:acetyl-CoA acyltransferase|nr:acetyl-CoA acyltransferase [Thermoplasmata archaeon]